MNTNAYDTTYGLKPFEGSNQFKLGNKKVYVLGNNIRIEGKLYELDGEEWKLLTLKDPGGLKNYKKVALKNYYNILAHTSAFLQEYGSFIWSERNKYNDIIKFIHRQ